MIKDSLDGGFQKENCLDRSLPFNSYSVLQSEAKITVHLARQQSGPTRCKWIRPKELLINISVHCTHTANACLLCEESLLVRSSQIFGTSFFIGHKNHLIKRYGKIQEQTFYILP